MRNSFIIYLVLEICEMTRLTYVDRANFILMRNLGKVLHKYPY
jgi:hypothetical protein